MTPSVAFSDSSLPEGALILAKLQQNHASRREGGGMAKP